MKELSDGSDLNYGNDIPMKKKGLSSKVIGIGALIVIGFWMMSQYNGFVSLDENTGESWGAVEAAYQARADKTKNLLEIVKGAGNYEQETLIGVTKARAEASSMNLTVENLTPENIAKYQQLQNNMGGALSRLLATFERYPDLKAVKGYQDFQSQYEGMENRIETARLRFNDTVKPYNVKVKKVPGKFVAAIFGFDEKGYFKSDAGSENAPDISFE